MPPRLFRVIVQVGHIDAAAEFYAALLELPGTRVSIGRHYFDCGGTILACFDPLVEDGVEAAPNPDHVYLSVVDLDATYERARAVGCETLTEIEMQPWGERSFYGRDPWGNPLCFVQAGTEFTG